MPDDRLDRSDDVALVREVVAGSQDALAVLYDRHAAAIYRVATRLTTDHQVAEEVVQETFLILWNRAELFSAQSGSLAAWIHTIARNRTVDRLRAASRRPALVSISAARPDDRGEDAFEAMLRRGAIVGGAAADRGPESAMEAAEVRATIESALAGMPTQERTVIELAYREELTQIEIADRLGWPLGTVKTRTRRALRRLREELAGSLGTGSDPGERNARRSDSGTVPVRIGPVELHD
jgi:RNA polymerase sigma factor (sigma-70 family)